VITLATPLCDENVTPAPGAELVAAAVADAVLATLSAPNRAAAETTATMRLRISIPLRDDKQPTKRDRSGHARITRSYLRNAAFCNKPTWPGGLAPQANPGLVATAVTTAALCSGPFTPLMVQDTVVVALWPTSGWTVIEQVPSTLSVCGSVIVKATVDGAFAAFFPPRFFNDAATTHGEVQPDVSTETTV